MAAILSDAVLTLPQPAGDDHRPRPDVAALRVVQSLLEPIQAMLAKCCGKSSPEDATAWETLYRACRVVAESFAGMIA